MPTQVANGYGECRRPKLSAAEAPILGSGNFLGDRGHADARKRGSNF